jgi:hypothetical protein
MADTTRYHVTTRRGRHLAEFYVYAQARAFADCRDKKCPKHAPHIIKWNYITGE